MGTMLIGYDVEWRGARGDGDVTERFLDRVQELHNRLGIPATLFILGQTLERCPQAFQPLVDDPLFDLQQHTYSHQLLKTVYIEDGGRVQVIRGADLDTIRWEVHLTNDLLRDLLGVECIGLTGPWCYYRGLRDRPDILQVLWEEGIRFTRTDGRNEHDYHPVPLDLQPYWYEHVGFPEMLELTIHGWHDCVLRDSLGWQDLDGYVESVKPYIGRAASENKLFSYVQHDWSSIQEDPEMKATEALLRYAQERQLTFMSCREYYELACSMREHREATTSVLRREASR
ncbi:polysaccharide deacetylase [Thermobaculum terrenum ATCC BAA-798]|uniref:Polysaccharide deacetylase n=1 Tax=Thermobaculum terrenum (strain ATCC BAA-798 / CCMEE 7001 / YNP1) TaxID=525904 RepID=D1CH91_THET1|nr:polysaccharide deacetylase family protein [Thermobaculum terrenum]ACZ43112.1 polysaccharide deacetylase [Thermobaculum terrenum ATCC BAA-798]